GRLSVYSASSENFWGLLNEHYSSHQLRWIEQLIKQGFSFYLPEIQSGYLARLSVNHAAALAVQYLAFFSGTKGALMIPGPENFRRLILQQSFIYLGSKMVNPKRKSPTLRDLQAALLAQNEQGALLSAMRLALQQ